MGSTVIGTFCWGLVTGVALGVWRTRVNLLWLVDAGALLGALGIVG